jgi:phosphoribosylformylglycinamidine synthase subunit PurS
VSRYTAEVRITPRAGLLDPEGKAVQNALHSLEFEDVEDVRVGRLIKLRLRADNDDGARASADEMCRRLLANPVTEDYEIVLVKGS